MKLIPLSLLVGIFVVSGWAYDYRTPEPYSAELVKKAEAGDAVAQFDLGLCYSEGLVVAKDKKEALKWITKSAEQGYSFAQSDLGVRYLLGLGVAKDEKEALKWYKKVAEQEATPTTPAQSFKGTYEQNYLGDYYSFTKDYKEAVKWYTKAAEQGDTQAQNNLGSLYYKGEGVTQDYKEAVKWYTKSAEQGNAEAQRILAVCYEKGTGVAKDEKEALKWSEKAKAENKRRRVVTRDEETIDDSTPAMAIASLTDPQILANLQGERASNSRFQKCLYWLATARAKGESPSDIIASANLKNGEQVTSYGTLLSSSLTANLAEADKLGLFSPEGLDELRQGKSATITEGEYSGQKAEAEDVIPVALCPELQNQVMNLELLPASLKRSKSDKVTERAKVFAKELYDAKLLSEEGWGRVAARFSK
jgi:tetratricopeptide (TPR) repeat protein